LRDYRAGLAGSNPVLRVQKGHKNVAFCTLEVQAKPS
jgi:hypothetical protein